MGSVATIGVFDGVHKGHRYLLRELRRVAERLETDGAERLQTAVMVLDMARGGQLTTIDERVELLKLAGIEAVHVFRFEDIRSMTAEAFMQVLRKEYNVDVLLMGYDHRFGCDQMAEFADYEACAAKVGLRLVHVGESPDERVSSSRIRQALTDGDIVQANALLGYPYSLTGTVVRGNRIGHTIGFPTANIEPDPCKLVPKAGVYAGTISDERLGISECRSLVNIGTNPTVGNERVTIEAYLTDYTGGELYGETLTLRFVQRIRDEKKFASLDELRNQISEDISFSRRSG